MHVRALGIELTFVYAPTDAAEFHREHAYAHAAAADVRVDNRNLDLGLAHEVMQPDLDALRSRTESISSEPPSCIPCMANPSSQPTPKSRSDIVAFDPARQQHFQQQHHFDTGRGHASNNDGEYYMASPLVCPRLMTLPDAGGDRTRFVYDSPSSAYDGFERSRSIAQADEGIGPHVHVSMHPAFRFENDPTDTVANAFERLPNSGAASERTCATTPAKLSAVVSNLKTFDLDDEAQQVRGRGSLVKWRTRPYNDLTRAVDDTKKEGSAGTGAAAS